MVFDPYRHPYQTTGVVGLDLRRHTRRYVDNRRKSKRDAIEARSDGLRRRLSVRFPSTTFTVT